MRAIPAAIIQVLELLKKAEILTERDLAGRAVTFNNLACYYRRQGACRLSVADGSGGFPSHDASAVHVSPRRPPMPPGRSRRARDMRSREWARADRCQRARFGAVVATPTAPPPVSAFADAHTLSRRRRRRRRDPSAVASVPCRSSLSRGLSLAGKLHAALQYLQKALKIEGRLEHVDNPADTCVIAQNRAIYIIYNVYIRYIYI